MKLILISHAAMQVIEEDLDKLATRLMVLYAICYMLYADMQVHQKTLIELAASLMMPHAICYMLYAVCYMQKVRLNKL